MTRKKFEKEVTKYKNVVFFGVLQRRMLVYVISKNSRLIWDAKRF